MVQAGIVRKGTAAAEAAAVRNPYIYQEALQSSQIRGGGAGGWKGGNQKPPAGSIN